MAYTGVNGRYLRHVFGEEHLRCPYSRRSSDGIGVGLPELPGGIMLGLPVGPEVDAMGTLD